MKYKKTPQTNTLNKKKNRTTKKQTLLPNL